MKRKGLFVLCGVLLLGSQIPGLPLEPKGSDLVAVGERVAEGMALWWEEDLTFQSRCFKHGTVLRLVAFRITNPDVSPAEDHNVRVAAELIKGEVVTPGAVFSLNTALGPRTGERNFRQGLTYYGAEQIYTLGGGICRLATILYNGAILANLEVIERWPHSMPVPYVPLGQDATIATYKDLKFQNTTSAPLLIWTEYKDQTLYLAFYGREKPPVVKWGHEIIARWPFETEYRTNPQLKPGEKRVASPGAAGMRVRSWVTIEEPNGERRQKALGIDSYYPKRELIEVGPLTFRSE
jgi:vancomycin resistance protein YoaR